MVYCCNDLWLWKKQRVTGNSSSLGLPDQVAILFALWYERDGRVGEKREKGGSARVRAFKERGETRATVVRGWI